MSEAAPVCDICGEEWEDGHEGEDWNGETGCHRTCEEARDTRDLRLTNIVEQIIRQAAKGNAMDASFYVAVIVDNVETTALDEDQRSWLTLEDEDDES